MDAITILVALSTGGGSVWFIKKAFELGYFEAATGNQKAAGVLATTFILGIGSAVALIFAGHSTMPVDVFGWLNALAPSAFYAYGASQTIFVWLKSRNPEFSKAR